MNHTTENLLSKEELREKLNLESTRGVDELVRKRKIPVIRLGHRTVRFSWPDVQRAIGKLTLVEVGEMKAPTPARPR